MAQNEVEQVEVKSIGTGAEQTGQYVSSLVGKKVAIVGNQTSMIGKQHLVDSLLNANINIVKVFSPEHGFRGKADAGEKVESGKDTKTGLPIISLYGNNKKPTQAQLTGIDVIVFDIQDVGARFYTYISTLHYVMEAAAEAKIPVIVLDRPNPNGHIVDGPVLDMKYSSFVGMHPVPILYGMTIGEYAKMINGEGWINGDLVCDLNVIQLANYTHESKYSLPVAPSPNLKSDQSIMLYPSLCLFEGTTISVGRGTETPFEVFGHPDFPDSLYSFKPLPTEGAKNPKLNGKNCYGFNLHDESRLDGFSLAYLVEARRYMKDNSWLNNAKFFNLLAGNSILLEQIKKGLSEDEIRQTWQDDLNAFKAIRSKYLMYD